MSRCSVWLLLVLVQNDSSYVQEITKMIRFFLKKLAEIKFSSSSAETNSSDHGPWVNNSNNDNNNNNNDDGVITVGFFCFVLFLFFVFFVLQSSQCPCLHHVHSSGQTAIVCKSRATHRVLISCKMSCATWYEGTAQLLRLTEFKSHLC